jgi:hypothetical protein
MHSGSALTWRRFAGLAVAGALAIAGLWLAVGAGADNEGGTRAAAYPTPTFPYKMHITSHPSKQTHSHKAKFRFHVTYNPSGHVPQSQLQYLDYKCKLDAKSYRKCTSPKRYRHLKVGKHKFRVKAVYSNGAGDASDPAKYIWKVIK